MISFDLKGFYDPPDDPPKVTVQPDGVSEDQIRDFPAFNIWCGTLRRSLYEQSTIEDHPFYDSPFKLKSITIQSVDIFRNGQIGFLKLNAEIKNERGQELPGICFLRGGSVGILMILTPRDAIDEKWVIMTSQPRVPAGTLTFVEIPAGMLDYHRGTFAGKAALEIEEETGLSIPTGELRDLTQLALEGSEIEEHKQLKPAMYPSPGGCDEYIALMLWEKEMDRQEIEDLKGRLTGLRTQGELITLKLLPYAELWREGARDAKTLAAWALYEGLKRAGKL
ncbi:hypothetical protein PV08_09158 [Exophiala spinifera]|uniref:Nudix hydrolase domain-containing protein n=1 Tax=Exophiala spinifera TaxID=91928 RepID=A0A0D2AZK7_9EURO|nr:uncharacterized protein PV08_09158 [Exophiala spinifera]KIW11885.1 hypothetical protein PV08_09158 [Exophiala spinifera]